MADGGLDRGCLAVEALDELDTWIVMEIEMPEMEVTVIDELSTHEDLGGPPIND